MTRGNHGYKYHLLDLEYAKLYRDQMARERAQREAYNQQLAMAGLQMGQDILARDKAMAMESVDRDLARQAQMIANFDAGNRAANSARWQREAERMNPNSTSGREAAQKHNLLSSLSLYSTLKPGGIGATKIVNPSPGMGQQPSLWEIGAVKRATDLELERQEESLLMDRERRKMARSQRRGLYDLARGGR